MSRQSTLVTIVLLAMLGLAFYPSVYAWGSSPQITHSLDGLGSNVLTIEFNFSQMSDPPTTSHFPTEFQVRTSTDGSSWTELASVPITPTPITTVFTVTYNLRQVSGTVQVQARLRCSIHGWSDWRPDPAVPVPEFPFGMIAAASLLILVGALLTFQRKRQVAPSQTLNVK